MVRKTRVHTQRRTHGLQYRNPHPHPSTHGQVVFASKRWRYEGKGKGGGEEIKLKTILPQFFYRGPPPPIPPPPPIAAPPTFAQSCCFYSPFWPGFFYSPFWPVWWCEEEGEEKVHLLTHGSTSGDHG